MIDLMTDVLIIGGLLMDTGFISLKPKEHERGIESYHKNSLLPGQPKIEVAPLFEMDDPVVVEWRALTTAYLDIVAERVRDALRLNRNKLSLTRLMDGATWSVSYMFIDLFHQANLMIHRLAVSLQRFLVPILKNHLSLSR